MGKTDLRVDAYIENVADFAKPVLKHLRALIHNTVPEVEETIKWQFPHFEFKGTICSMAAFKNHCTFTLAKGALISDTYGIMSKVGESAMGQFGRICALNDLPDDKILIEYILQAVELNEKGVKKTVSKITSKDLVIPDFIVTALSVNKKAEVTFNNFTYSHKKEYVQWITEAKTDTTREKRIATMLEWLEEGKSKNWKYEKK
jgi:hypothetical protein